MKGFTKISKNTNYSINVDGQIINKYGEIKVPQRSSKGYLRVKLYNNGVPTHESIHKLVAETFIPNPDNKPEVNHRDGNKQNNHVSNLEWATKSENMIHAYQTGLVKPHATYGMRGHTNPNGGRKGLPIRIIETNEIFNSVKDCAEAIGGSDRRICECAKGKRDSHCGYHFEYL